MRFIKIAFRPETLMPMAALTLASAANVALVLLRIFWTRDIHYGFLIWNLFLAWVPLVFALLACDLYRAGAARTGPFALLAGAWLLFFPNAPYICTDIIHLNTHLFGRFWVDMVLVLSCALTGLVLGFVSLFLMHAMVVRSAGRFVSWIFIAAVAGLSGFGIYLGRFQRFNSWDVLLKPVSLVRDVGHWALGSAAHPHSYAFPVLFAGFIFLSYMMLYALTHMPQASVAVSREPEPM